MELTQNQTKKEKSQGSRTIRLEMLTYKKLRGIQNNTATSKKIISFSHIIDSLIEKNKYYRLQLKENENEQTN